MPSITLAGRVISSPDQPSVGARESNLIQQLRKLTCCPAHSRAIFKSVPTWNRTRTKTLGKSCAVRYTIETCLLKSRRLDSHQHQPVYKSGAFLTRATSARKHEREESNPVRQFWRPPALPGAHSCGSKGVARGIEPPPPAWNAGALPLSYTRT